MGNCFLRCWGVWLLKFLLLLLKFLLLLLCLLPLPLLFLPLPGQLPLLLVLLLSPLPSSPFPALRPRVDSFGGLTSPEEADESGSAAPVSCAWAGMTNGTQRAIGKIAFFRTDVVIWAFPRKAVRNDNLDHNHGPFRA